MPRMLEPGALCRSKDAIIKCDDEEKSRLCRVIGIVPETRWRIPGVPEYKVELVSLPVTAFRRDDDLVPLPPSDFFFDQGTA
jgi:hypothetical protein